MLSTYKVQALALLVLRLLMSKSNEGKSSNKLKQKGDFTRYPNWLLDALSTRKLNLTALAYIVLSKIVRETYGWHKQWYQASYRKWEEVTGYEKRTVEELLPRLCKRGIIERRPVTVRGGKSFEYRVNPDLEKAVKNMTDSKEVPNFTGHLKDKSTEVDRDTSSDIQVPQSDRIEVPNPTGHLKRPNPDRNSIIERLKKSKESKSPRVREKNDFPAYSSSPQIAEKAVDKEGVSIDDFVPSSQEKLLPKSVAGGEVEDAEYL